MPIALHGLVCKASHRLAIDARLQRLTDFDGRHTMPAVFEDNANAASGYTLAQPTHDTTGHKHILHCWYSSVRTLQCKYKL